MNLYTNAMGCAGDGEKRLLNVEMERWEVQMKRLQIRFCLLIVSPNTGGSSLVLVLLRLEECVPVCVCVFMKLTQLSFK